MSAKHTPGPWEIERGYNTIIKSIGPCVPDEYAGSAWLEVPDADALLIAAAPDLLEALKAMVALDEEHHQRCQGDEDVCREVRQARYAIAKAIGDTK